MLMIEPDSCGHPVYKCDHTQFVELYVLLLWSKLDGTSLVVCSLVVVHHSKLDGTYRLLKISIGSGYPG